MITANHQLKPRYSKALRYSNLCNFKLNWFQEMHKKVSELMQKLPSHSVKEGNSGNQKTLRDVLVWKSLIRNRYNMPFTVVYKTHYWHVVTNFVRRQCHHVQQRWTPNGLRTKWSKRSVSQIQFWLFGQSCFDSSRSFRDSPFQTKPGKTIPLHFYHCSNVLWIRLILFELFAMAKIKGLAGPW